MNKHAWLGLDIGGANLKAADGRGFAASRPFPLWKQPHVLAAELTRLIGTAPRADRLAITMTGELADCFETKAEGVRHILQSAEQAAGPRELAVYLVTGEMVAPTVARQMPHLAAASNWHALAAFACRFVTGQVAGSPPRSARSESCAGPQSPAGLQVPLGLLLDIGSTTTDIVPIGGERPLSQCRSDVERLLSQELVYSGVRRSPVCGLVRELPWRGAMCRVALEWFATTADVYVLLEELSEDGQRVDTADGRPLTRSAAHARLARMLCMDQDDFCYNDACLAAAAVRAAQLDQLRRAVTEVVMNMPQTPSTVVISGEGGFLAPSLLPAGMDGARKIFLADELGPEVSRAAPAHAVAVLAREREEVRQ